MATPILPSTTTTEAPSSSPILMSTTQALNIMSTRASQAATLANNQTAREQAKHTACELYKLMGDFVQMRRIGCEDIPPGPKKLTTIPMGDEHGSSVDNDLADAMRYMVLSVLLLIAVIMLMVCCCKTCSRVSRRRELNNRNANLPTTEENKSSYRPCCGGLLGAAARLQTDSYRPATYLSTARTAFGGSFGVGEGGYVGPGSIRGTGAVVEGRQNFKLTNECHDCATSWNLI